MDPNHLRYCPQRDFPPYAFIPGKFPHPEKPGGHMHGHKLHTSPLDPEKPQDNEDYLYGLDLYNFGYYWEAHVWWEELWNHAGRKGELADFLKGLIKLAAGGVKIELKEEKVSRGHIERARELLSPLEKKYSCYSGLNLTELLRDLDQLLINEEDFRALKLNLMD